MNKKSLMAVAAGAVIGIGIYGVTKKKQKEAEREGSHRPYGPYEAVMKRPLDIILSGIALLLLSPVLLVAAILVKIKLGSPVLFTQDRPGKIDLKTGEEKIFKIYKFRSMTDEKDIHGNLLPDGQRLTPFGRQIRATSIDELPELINIFRGDMSIVGPRPLIPQYIPLYSKEQRHRDDVLPGLTGLAQAHGRNGISWDEKFKYDLEYVNKITFFGDARIIMETAIEVLTKKGINSKTAPTMEPFLGCGKTDEMTDT